MVEDAPKPSRAPGEVLIEVLAASVNPIDYKVRRGDLWFIPLAKPKCPGGDACGTVVEADPGGRFKPGDRVYLLTTRFMPNSKLGCYCEFVSVPDAHVAKAPASLSSEAAAALPVVALTAWQALDAAALAPGQRVLVHAAAGGVGSVAVQLAKQRGLVVAATCSAGNADYVRKLGADEVIDYNASKFEEVLSGDKQVDAVIDGIGGAYEARSARALKKGGSLISLLPNPVNMVVGKLKSALRLGPRYRVLMVEPSSKQLEELAALIDAGKVAVPAVETLPLADARRAHEKIEGGHVRGKLVLRVKG